MASRQNSNGSNPTAMSEKLGNLRHFRTNKEGKVVACDTVECVAFHLLPYMAGIEDVNPSFPPGYVRPDKNGNVSASAFAALTPAQATESVRRAEMIRFHIMFVRAQDACRELLVALAAWMICLRELCRLCKVIPEDVSKQVKYDMTVATVVFAFNKEEIMKFSATDCELGDPTLGEIVDKCLENAQQEFNKLPKHVTTIAKEVRKLTTNLPKAMQELGKSSRDTARHVIHLQAAVENCKAESEQILAHLKALGIV